MAEGRSDPGAMLRLVERGVSVDQDGGGGDVGGREQRLRAIEDRLLTIETKSNHFDTREDLRADVASVARIESSVHRELHAQTWTLVGSVAAGLIAVAFFPGRLVVPAAEPAPGTGTTSDARP